MNEDKEKNLSKQLRAEFFISISSGIILLIMGIFTIIVCRKYPSFAAEIGLPVKLEEITGFPLFDVFGYLFQGLMSILIRGIYGIYPAFFGFIITLESVLTRLFENKYVNISERQRHSSSMENKVLCIIIGNVVLTISLSELGIYPKIHLTVNVLMAAVIIVKKIIIKIKEDREYNMKISTLFKSIIDSDIAPIVICDLSHTIIYMNPTAVERYAKRGGERLIGSSLLDCHNEDSNEKIKTVIDWFEQSADNNRIFTFHNDKEDKDVYMIALRDDDRRLIGYYEKHECRQRETALPYEVEISV